MDGRYNKVYTDAVGNFEIVYVYPDGREQVVDTNQDLYLEWLALGNTPTEIPYVPPVPPTPPVEELLSIKNRLMFNIDVKTKTLIYVGFVYNSTLFSLSDAAQGNWTRMQLMKVSGMLTFPQTVSTAAEVGYVLADEAAFTGFIIAYAATVKGRLDSGIALRASVMNVYDSTTMTDEEKRTWFAAFTDPRT
jgi:hypothetical protein